MTPERWIIGPAFGGHLNMLCFRFTFRQIDKEGYLSNVRRYLE